MHRCIGRLGDRWAPEHDDHRTGPIGDRVGHGIGGTVPRLAPTEGVDESLDDQSEKTRFWNAFKALGPWWAEQPPY